MRTKRAQVIRWFWRALACIISVNFIDALAHSFGLPFWLAWLIAAGQLLFVIQQSQWLLPTPTQKGKTDGVGRTES